MKRDIRLFFTVATLPIWGPFYLAEQVNPHIWFKFKKTIGLKRVRLGSDTHGDAEWAEHEHFWEAGLSRNEGGFLVGKTQSGAKQVSVYAHPENSLVMISPRGGGKSSHMKAIINDQLKLPYAKLPDMLVVDPVGEHERQFGEDLRNAGWAVGTFDIGAPDSSVRYSPFAELDISRNGAFSDVYNLAYSVIPQSATDANAHFRDVPRVLLAASIYYHLKMEPQKATLRHCMNSIVASTAELQNLFSKFERAGDDDALRHALKVAQTVGQKEYGSFITTTSTLFRPFQDPQWQALTQMGVEPDGTLSHGWSFADMYERDMPSFIFLRLGMDSKVTGPLARLILSNALLARKRMMLKKHGKSFKRRLMILADEPKELGDCAAFTMAQNDLRKAGVNLFLPFLTMEDIHSIYTDPESIIQGSTLIFTGGITSVKTLEFASKLAGKFTAMGRGTTESGHGSSSSQHEIGVALINPDKIMRLPKDQQLVIGSGLTSIVQKPFTYAGKEIRF